MKKLIFTPFSTENAGTLIGRLAYKPDIQTGKKGDGEYRGFMPYEYKFAPPLKSPGVYDASRPQLTELMNGDDELYINAHCSKGLDYLANNEKCDTDGVIKVSIGDLILQLRAHGLREKTRAKIKLWICEGALDKGENKSFAQRFSIAMHDEGYTECRIFGYTESVFGQYQSGSDDGLFHKRIIKSAEQRLGVIIQNLNAYNGNPPDARLNTMKRLWVATLKTHNNIEADAVKDILASEQKQRLLLGGDTTVVGGPANKHRIEFKRGAIVPQASAVTTAAATAAASSM